MDGYGPKPAVLSLEKGSQGRAFGGNPSFSPRGQPLFPNSGETVFQDGEYDALQSRFQEIVEQLDRIGAQPGLRLIKPWNTYRMSAKG